MLSVTGGWDAWRARGAAMTTSEESARLRVASSPGSGFPFAVLSGRVARHALLGLTGSAPATEILYAVKRFNNG